MNTNKEDYIKAIYELGGYRELIPNKAIAGELKVSPPSVSEMIKKLVEEDYLDYREYRGVQLTKKGILEARKIRRRHLLWEVFLVEKLGYSWLEVDEEAEILEHISSDRLVERLDAFLGRPQHCPHGSPLVLDSYEDSLSLLKARPGTSYRLLRIKDSPDVLEFCDQWGLAIGDEIRLLAREEDEVSLARGQDIIRLGQDLAGKIYLK